jgi:adenylosuccinate lyase
MNNSPLLALSPLDGRYAAKLASLRPIMSEMGYMQRRVQVEVTWLMALSHMGLKECPALSDEAKVFLIGLYQNFSHDDALSIKDIEKTTNHDVKAVEYWIKKQFKSTHLSQNIKQELEKIEEMVHFSMTSEDINNTSHALQIKTARDEVILPYVDGVIATMLRLSHEYAHVPMLSRTHGQTATPTSVGKEIANFVVRLKNAKNRIISVPLMAKMNGAVGNYNAQLAAYPHINWEHMARTVVESPPYQEGDKMDQNFGLGLCFQAYSTQIECHDYMAEFFDAISRMNVVLIDWCRDIWGYISLGYFKQRLKDGEIGSSTMPHKVNPIDFENAEGNLGLANALFKHMSEKLPISRFQRDLSDSTVIRNIGVAFGYSILAYQSLATGLSKLEINESKLSEDLESAWEVLAEPIQTVMRRYGVKGAYESLKDLTRGRVVKQEDLAKLIQSLDIPVEEKERLLQLRPDNYLGMASDLAKRTL